MKRLLSFVFIIILVFSFQCSLSYAKGGKLDRIERKIESKPSSPGRGTSDSSSSSGTGYSSSSSISGAEIMARTWWEVLALFMLAGLNTQGIGEGLSMSEKHAALRAVDSPLLPTFKIEGNYQYVRDHIHGYDATLTLGYMMFGVDVNMWHLFESQPDDQLKFISPHFLLRFAPFGFMQVDLAFGTKIIVGNNTHTGFEGGLPAYFFFTRNLIWDVKTYVAYINGRHLVDLSSGLNYRIKYFGIRAGYRMIEIGGEYTHGPQAGIFAQW